MASAGLAYYHGGDASKPVVYEDFLPASAAGIFRSNLDTDAQKADGDRFRAFFHAMLDQGVYLAPSPFEAGFVTTAHGDAELDQTLEAARRAFRKIS